MKAFSPFCDEVAAREGDLFFTICLANMHRNNILRESVKKMCLCPKKASRNILTFSGCLL